MRIALRQTSHAVLASATTVVLGVLSLTLSLFPTTRALGVACAVGVVVAATFALVALPATLVLFGRWVFWPKVPAAGLGVAGRRPLAVAAGRRRREPSYGAVRGRDPGSCSRSCPSAWSTYASDCPTAEQFLQKPEAISAGQRLAEHFPAGSSDPAVVLTRSPAGGGRGAEGAGRGRLREEDRRGRRLDRARRRPRRTPRTARPPGTRSSGCARRSTTSMAAATSAAARRRRSTRARRRPATAG